MHNYDVIRYSNINVASWRWQKSIGGVNVDSYLIPLNLFSAVWHSAEKPSTHHLLLLLQDDGLPGSLPKPEGLIMRRGDDVVSIGADGQAPDLTMMTLRNIQGSKFKNTVKMQQ